MPIIAPISRDERRLMEKTIHKMRDKNQARRLTVMLMLSKGASVSEVSRTLCCARSSIGRWINWFTLCGTEGLVSLRPGRERKWLFEQICRLLWYCSSATLPVILAISAPAGVLGFLP